MGHPHQRIVNGRVAVGMELTHDLADNPCALDIGSIPDVIGFVHRKQDPAMHWLETVSNIRQRSPHDDAHRVVKVGATHLLFKADGECFFGE